MLEDYGYQPHLVHPLRCKAIASARLKKDKVDAATLGRLLRADLLPEAWIAPLEVRQQRALLRHRCQLVRLRTLLRNRIHAVLADGGHDRAGGFSTAPGRAWIASLDLPDASRRVVDDLLTLIDAIQVPIDALDAQLAAHARGDPRVLIQAQTRDAVATFLDRPYVEAKLQGVGTGLYLAVGQHEPCRHDGEPVPGTTMSALRWCCRCSACTRSRRSAFRAVPAPSGPG